MDGIFCRYKITPIFQSWSPKSFEPSWISNDLPKNFAKQPTWKQLFESQCSLGQKMTVLVHVCGVESLKRGHESTRKPGSVDHPHEPCPSAKWTYTELKKPLQIWRGLSLPSFFFRPQKNQISSQVPLLVVSSFHGRERHNPRLLTLSCCL